MSKHPEPLALESKKHWLHNSGLGNADGNQHLVQLLNIPEFASQRTGLRKFARYFAAKLGFTTVSAKITYGLVACELIPLECVHSKAQCVRGCLCGSQGSKYRVRKRGRKILTRNLREKEDGFVQYRDYYSRTPSIRSKTLGLWLSEHILVRATLHHHISLCAIPSAVIELVFAYVDSYCASCQAPISTYACTLGESARQCSRCSNEGCVGCLNHCSECKLHMCEMCTLSHFDVCKGFIPVTKSGWERVVASTVLSDSMLI